MHNVYYFTDIHGNLKLFNNVLQWCKKQDDECTIIFGGDAADRGEDGFQIMHQLLNDPQIIYLKGNHEDIFVRAAKDIYSLEPNIQIKSILEAKSFLNENVTLLHRLNLSLINDGESTLCQWLINGAKKDIIEQLDRLPLTFSYENLDFCHSGSTPKAFRMVADAEYNENKIDVFAAQTLLWDRNNLHLGWFSNRIMIFGHTPSFYIPKSGGNEKNPQPILYKGLTSRKTYPGWKLAMDVCTILSKRLYILDCLTLTAYGFVEDTAEPFEKISFYDIINSKKEE